MRVSRRQLLFIICFLVVCTGLNSCKKPPEGKLIVTEQEFTLRKDSDDSYALDAKGKIKNIGEVDVKQVEVTGFCKSCGEILTNGQWFVSDVEKRPEQKDVIGYLAAGDEEEFSFQDVAFFFGPGGIKPDGIPDLLEIKIVSFEVVKQ